MQLYISLTCAAALLCSCGPVNIRTQKGSTTMTIDSTAALIAADDLVATHRFSVKGDFDGDGREETLTEHFLYKDSQQEARKNWVDDSFAIISKEIWAGKTASFIGSDNPAIDTLRIAAPCMGIEFMKNEGDLNGDGKDELSYVPALADYSAINRWYIMTWQQHTWKELCSFEIRESILPYPGEDSLRHFKGLVHKISNKRIELIYINKDIDWDTTIIDLDHPKKFF